MVLGHACVPSLHLPSQATVGSVLLNLISHRFGFFIFLIFSLLRVAHIYIKVNEKHPLIAKVVGRGTLFAISDNKGLISQRTSGDCVRVYAALRVPERWATESGINFSDPAHARESLLELFSDWDSSLTDLMRKCDDSFLPRPIMALPVNLMWEMRDGVTLVGDAAHVMSPFAGEGMAKKEKK
jgi:hypothetical protein